MEIMVVDKTCLIRKFKDTDELLRWCDEHVMNEHTRKALAIPVIHVERFAYSKTTMCPKKYINQLLQQRK